MLGADGNSKFGIAGGQPIPGLSGFTLGGSLTGIGAGATIADSRREQVPGADPHHLPGCCPRAEVRRPALARRAEPLLCGNNGALGPFTYTGAYTGVDFGDFLLEPTLQPKAAAPSPASGDIATGATLVFFQDDWKAAAT